MSDENVIIDNLIEEEYDTVDVLDIEQDIIQDETIHIIEVDDISTYTVETDEAFRALGESNEQLKHSILNGRDLPDQHPITAITGLRNELDNIEALQTVYSDEKQVADYYEWADGNVLQENRIGFFVSVCDDIRMIKICDGGEVFGVTVDAAAFIGGQDDILRDCKYGLVTYSGVVHVRCESDVDVGDFIISNNYGVAKKANHNYGCEVIALHEIDGILYAAVSLGVSINQMDAVGAELESLGNRMTDAETNIVSAINLANEAYNKASQASSASENAEKNSSEALDKVDKIVSDNENWQTEFSQLATDAQRLSAEAQVIANSAIVSAERIRKEAVDEANKALTTANETKQELEDTAMQMQRDIENAALQLEAAKENIQNTKTELQGKIDDTVDRIKELETDLEPLATWPDAENPSGIAGFVARADEDSATLASITKFEGEFGESISGFVQEATKENATVAAIASYQQKDQDGNPYGPSGASVLMGQVDANKASIDALASLEGDGFSGLAGLTAQVNKNTSSVTTLASHVVGDFENTDDWVEDGKDTNKVYYAKNNRLYYYYANQKWYGTTKAYEAGLTGSIAGVQSVADDNKAQLDAMVSYDKEGKSALAGLTAYVDENSASLSTLAKYNNEDSGNSGIAGLVADIDDNTSTLSAVVSHEFTKNDGTVVTGLAGLNEYVNENESKVELVAKRVNGKYIIVPELVDEHERDKTKIYSSYDSQKKVTTYYYYDNGVWKTTTTWASVMGKDAYTVYYTSANKTYWYYTFGDNTWHSTPNAEEAGLPTAIAGIQVETDDNSSRINSLVSWSGKTSDSMASIEQKADENGASLNFLVSNVDKYSVGEYSQAYGLSYDQAKNILKNDMIYVPTTSHSETDAISIVDSFTALTTNEKNTQTVYYDKTNKNYRYYTTSWKSTTNESTAKTYLRTNVFSRESYYIWKDGDWEEHSNGVAFSAVKVIGSDNAPYWYIDSSTAPQGYEAYALYLWYTPGDENEDKTPYWKKVNILSGNASNRVTSLIRQTANQIALDVVNTKGDVASHQQWLDDNSSNIQDLVSWAKDGTEGNVEFTNLATIKQTADENGANIAQVAYKIGGYETVTSWSSSGKDTSKVYYNTANKNYYYYKSGWKTTTDPFEAGVVIDAASIVTAINDRNETSVKLTGDHIILNGAITNGNASFKVLENGNMQATGGTIGNWNIGTNSLYYGSETSPTFYLGTTGISAQIGSMARTNLVLKAGDNFGVSSGGALYAHNIQVTGGKIGNWTVWEKTMLAAQADISGTWNNKSYYKVELCLQNRSTNSLEDSVIYVHYLNNKDYTSTEEGYVVHSPFTLQRNGQLTCYDIQARGGTIGGWTIEHNDGTSMGSLSYNNKSLYLGTQGYNTTINGTTDDFVFKAGSKFGVTRNGTLCASGVKIEGSGIFSGTITAKGGTLQNGIKFGTNEKTQILDYSGGTAWAYVSGTTQDPLIYLTSSSINMHCGKTSITNDLNAEIILQKGSQNSDGVVGYTSGYLKGMWEFNMPTLKMYNTSGTYHITRILHPFIEQSNDGKQRQDAIVFKDVSSTTYIDKDGEWIRDDSGYSSYYSFVIDAYRGYFAGSWHSASGISNVSDKNAKNTISPLVDKYEIMFDGLKACTFKYNDGTSDRLHTGFIAQEVKEAMDIAGIDSQEFAALTIHNYDTDNPTGWGLRYSEFVSLNTWQIQKAKTRITELENEVATLKEQVAMLIKE